MAGGKVSETFSDAKVAVATAFADLFIHHRTSIDDLVFQVLKEEFSDQEISELCAFISFITASQLFGALLDLKPSTQN